MRVKSVKVRTFDGYRYVWQCSNCNSINTVLNNGKFVTSIVIRRCFSCDCEHDIEIQTIEKEEKVMIIWVQKEVVFAKCDQRAAITSITDNNIEIQLLGTGEEWSIQPHDIIGIELNKHLTIRFKDPSYTINKHPASKGTIIRVQKEAVGASTDQRAIINKTMDFANIGGTIGAGINVEVQLLGNDRVFNILPKNIIGIELNKHLTLLFRCTAYNTKKTINTGTITGRIAGTKYSAIDRLLKEGYEINIGPHEKCEGYFAEVSNTGLRDRWWDCGHGFSGEEALRNGESIAKGENPKSKYSPECFEITKEKE